MAWSILNDSLKTELCMHHQPSAIACAAIYIAAEMISLHLNGEWWDKCGCRTSTLEEIARQLLDLLEEQE